MNLIYNYIALGIVIATITHFTNLAYTYFSGAFELNVAGLVILSGMAGLGITVFVVASVLRLSDF